MTTPDPHEFGGRSSSYATADFLVSGQVAIVTGGTRGLGRSIVRRLADAGADVVIASRDGEACARYADEIRLATGRNTLPYRLHVGHWAEHDGFVKAVYERFGRIDILVNNAGMSPLYDSLLDVTEELFDKVLAVNLKGPFRLSALVGEKMRARGHGSIINISSMGAVRPRPDIAPYAAAKAGLNAVTVALARALGPEVRCNAIMAGTFWTDVSRSWDSERFGARAQTFALKRAGEASELAATVLYLASEASSYTTGSLIRVDGGQP